MRKIFLFILGSLLLMTLPALAQNNCVPVRGIAQIHLLDFANPDWQGGRPGDAWVGPVQLALGNDDVLIGKISEFDGEPGPSKHTGQGRDTGSFFFDFGAAGTFTARYSHAVWPTLPKFTSECTEAAECVVTMGTLHAEGSVDKTDGTGRFANATGKIMGDGTFIGWNLDQAIPSGRFNATLTGMLCDVAP